MNKITKIILSITSLFLTGCTAKYSLNISDIEVSEYVTIQNERIIIENDNKMINTFNKDYGKYYNITFNDDLLIDCYDAGKDDCSQFEKEYPLIIEGYRKMNDINDLENSQVIKDFFGTVTVSHNKITTISIRPKDELKMIFSNVNLVSPFITSLEVSIFTPYNIINNNADKIEDNTYTWTYNKDNLDKVLTISYTTDGDSGQIVDNDFNNNVNNNADNNTSNNQGNKTINSSNYVFWIILFGILIVVGVFVLKKMKNNDSV